MSNPRPYLREYPFQVELTTRWMDNDIYGHVNNVAYYSYFDSAANLFLIREGGLDIATSDVIGLVAESACQYHAPVAYPETLVAGVRVDRLGNRSVTYGIAIFRAPPGVDLVADTDAELAVAHGHFVHVFVDRATRQPTAIPPRMRDALARIVAVSPSR